MTNEEAIRLVDDRMCYGRGKWSKYHQPVIDEYWQAGEMAIKALEAEPHWTPVTEKLPEESGLYLVTERGMFGDSVYTRYWNYDRSGRKGHWSGYGNSAEVTAWCELPEPYKEVTE